MTSRTFETLFNHMVCSIDGFYKLESEKSACLKLSDSHRTERCLRDNNCSSLKSLRSQNDHSFMGNVCVYLIKVSEIITHLWQNTRTCFCYFIIDFFFVFHHHFFYSICFMVEFRFELFGFCYLDR